MPNVTLSTLAELRAEARFWASYYADAARDEASKGNRVQAAYYRGQANAYRYMLSLAAD